ncbi:hypothetical protein DUI87_28124 [Hirundo rustica rustica]|uniref:Uncharacterized protein n=1 Tax=Hirundo rustica rustica TaxID=333673 RepID=A0A3M0J949_HIRRU|nr:hypothetical protein DUI87_28124 [Hirundo rustica rustica]
MPSALGAGLVPHIDHSSTMNRQKPPITGENHKPACNPGKKVLALITFLHELCNTRPKDCSNKVESYRSKISDWSCISGVAEAILVRCADNIKLRGKVNALKRRTAIQRDLGKAEESGESLVQFSVEKSPAPRKSEPQAAVQARHGLPEQQLCRKGRRAGSNQAQQYPSLPYYRHNQEMKESDGSTLIQYFLDNTKISY